MIERALDIQAAEKQVKEAQAAVDNETALRTRLEAISGERGVLATQRSAITVPIPGALGPCVSSLQISQRPVARLTSVL